MKNIGWIIDWHEWIPALEEIMDWAEQVADDIRVRLQKEWHGEYMKQNLKETEQIIDACKRRIAYINSLTH